MIKLKEILIEENDGWVEYGIPRKGVGQFQYPYDVDFDKLKMELDKEGFKGRYSYEDMLPDEDYVLLRSERKIRLYSKKAIGNSRISNILRKYGMKPI